VGSGNGDSIRVELQLTYSPETTRVIQISILSTLPGWIPPGLRLVSSDYSYDISPRIDRALPTLQLTRISPTTTALALAPYTFPYTPDQYVRYIFDSPTISKSKKNRSPGSRERSCSDSVRRRQETDRSDGCPGAAGEVWALALAIAGRLNM
jgi:hypothetical protein